MSMASKKQRSGSPAFEKLRKSRLDKRIVEYQKQTIVELEIELSKLSNWRHALSVGRRLALFRFTEWANRFGSGDHASAKEAAVASAELYVSAQLYLHSRMESADGFAHSAVLEYTVLAAYFLLLATGEIEKSARVRRHLLRSRCDGAMEHLTVDQSQFHTFMQLMLQADETNQWPTLSETQRNELGAFASVWTFGHAGDLSEYFDFRAARGLGYADQFAARRLAEPYVDFLTGGGFELLPLEVFALRALHARLAGSTPELRETHPMLTQCNAQRVSVASRDGHERVGSPDRSLWPDGSSVTAGTSIVSSRRPTVSRLRPTRTDHTRITRRSPPVVTN